jgi:protein-disulfide isomerase
MGQIGGIPTAVFAFGFYTAMTAGCFSGWRSKSEMAVSTLTTGAALAAVTSAFMAYQSKVVIDAWCLFCVGLYGIAGILAISAIAAKRRREGAAFEGIFNSENRATWSAFPAGFVAFAVGAAMNTTSATTAATSAPANLSDIYEPAIAPVALSGNEPALGRFTAEWQVVDFADFNCGHCAQDAGPTQEVVNRYDNAKLIHKNYAFVNEGSILAAEAATCAAKQNRFWEISEILFTNAPTSDRSAVDFIAVTMAGLDSDLYNECMADPATSASVTTEREAGSASGVQGTPTLFVNLGAQSQDSWIRVLGGPEELEQILIAAENGEVLDVAQEQ